MSVATACAAALPTDLLRRVAAAHRPAYAKGVAQRLTRRQSFTVQPHDDTPVCAVFVTRGRTTRRLLVFYHTHNFCYVVSEKLYKFTLLPSPAAERVLGGLVSEREARYTAVVARLCDGRRQRSGATRYALRPVRAASRVLPAGARADVVCMIHGLVQSFTV